MAAVLTKLEEFKTADEIPPEVLDTIRLIAVTMNGLKGDTGLDD